MRPSFPEASVKIFLRVFHFVSFRNSDRAAFPFVYDDDVLNRPTSSSSSSSSSLSRSLPPSTNDRGSVYAHPNRHRCFWIVRTSTHTTVVLISSFYLIQLFLYEKIKVSLRRIRGEKLCIFHPRA